MKQMTRKEAMEEAERRWGAGGTILFRPPRQGASQHGRLARYCCIVGNGDAGAFSSVEGQGNTWREAFENVRPR